MDVVAIAALVIALLALSQARRTRKKLDVLNQSYWELRYDFTRLRSTVARLDPGDADDAPPPAAPPSQVTFVPLSSMKKKNE